MSEKEIIDLVSSEEEEEEEEKKEKVDNDEVKVLFTVSKGKQGSGDGKDNIATMGQVLSQGERKRESIKIGKWSGKRRKVESTEKEASTGSLRILIDGQDNSTLTEITESIDLYRKKNPLVLTCLGTCHHTRSTVRHIQQKDRWSCGYRNFQMMLTSLLPHLEPNHAFFQSVPRRDTHVSIPNIRQIQSALEQAWAQGYDPRGAQHYSHAIVGRNSWIGAVEVSTVMTYWGLDSVVVQFIRCKESREMLPKFVRSYFNKALGNEGCPFCEQQTARSDLVTEQLLQFASSSINIDQSCDCPLLPLYIQWEGHSMTIVGIDSDGTFLVLDPEKAGQRVKGDIKNKKVNKNFSVFHLLPKELISKDTQIIVTSLCSLSYQDKQSRMNEGKVLTAAQEAVKKLLKK